MSWLTDRQDRRRSNNQKEEHLRERATENLGMLMDLSRSMHDQVERLEEVTDRLEGALRE